MEIGSQKTMPKFTFIPSDWQPDDKLIEWTKSKGLTDAQIVDELESIKDHQYKTPRIREAACWRNWIKNGIRWGRIETVSTSQYRRPPKETEQDRTKAQTDFDNDPKIIAYKHNLKW